MSNPLAWVKDVEMESGQIVGYWVPYELITDLHSGESVLKCEGYLDQKHYERGSPKIMEWSCKLPCSDDGAALDLYSHGSKLAQEYQEKEIKECAVDAEAKLAQQEEQ